MSALLFPTFPPHIHLYPHNIPLIHCQSNLCAALRHSVSPHAAGGLFSVCFAKYFLPSLTFFFLSYFRDLHRSSHHLKAVTLHMDNLYYSCGGFGVLPCGEGGGGGGFQATGAMESLPHPSPFLLVGINVIDVIGVYIGYYPVI